MDQVWISDVPHRLVIINILKAFLAKQGITLSQMVSHFYLIMRKSITLNLFHSKYLNITNSLGREKESREGRWITWLVPSYPTVAQFHFSFV